MSPNWMINVRHAFTMRDSAASQLHTSRISSMLGVLLLIAYLRATQGTKWPLECIH